MKGERQSSELISFLQIQNKNFREENKELKELLQLNRQALKIALSPHQNQQQLSTLVGLLFQENSKLLLRCKHLNEQLDEKLCQALISEQIAQASNQHEKYVTGQLKERLKLLKKDIDAKDKRISDLNRQLGRSQLINIQNRQVEVAVIEFTDVNRVSERLFKEAESLRREIEIQSQEIFKLKEQKDELLKLNLILTRQVGQLKTYSCQTTASQKRDLNSSSSDLSKFLKYQAKIAQHSQDQSQNEVSESSDDQSDLPSQQEESKPEIKKGIYQKQSDNSFSYAPNAGSKKQEQSTINAEKANKVFMPKLQLKKAKEIQNLIVKKINNDEKKKSNHNVKDERSKKYEIQCEQLQKKLGKQILQKLRVERENLFLKKFISQLQQRNELLIRQRHESSLEKNYEIQRVDHQRQNIETLLDICRDVVLNQKLKAVCKGRQKLQIRKDTYSKQI